MMQKSTEKAGVDWIEVNVTDMQCGGCETVIEEALIVLDGVQDVSADYPTGSVKVAFDSEKPHRKTSRRRSRPAAIMWLPLNL
ncbi:heavy-metal-associated domain-containing protein [Thiolapillus sp.]|uniref:heavy-metal-associated domain-containing protein n=1 Tax=Thiolapillus sp. TaxID=2017437 RepID=UPI003AF59B77